MPSVLAPNGALLVYDCNPWNEIVATPFYLFQETRQNSVWYGSWGGDTWKTIVSLRSVKENLQISVLDCDAGLGLICRIVGATPQLHYTNEDIDLMTFDDLVRNRENLLNLEAAEISHAWLNELSDSAASLDFKYGS